MFWLKKYYQLEKILLQRFMALSKFIKIRITNYDWKADLISGNL